MKASRIATTVGAFFIVLLVVQVMILSPTHRGGMVPPEQNERHAEGRIAGEFLRPHKKAETFDQVVVELERLTALSLAQDEKLAALKVATAKEHFQVGEANGPAASPPPRSLPTAVEAPSRVGYPTAADPRKECTSTLAPSGSLPNRSDTYQCRQTDAVLVHIPKTGGTSIEQAAKKSASHLLWGMQYDIPRFRQKRKGLPRVESLIPVCRGNFGMKCCSWWHVPPRYTNDWRPYYSASKRFCAVRNPYAKVLSEYMFRHGKAIRKLPCDKLNKTEVNEWLRARMKGQLGGANTLDDCHWYPQYQYIEPNLGVAGEPSPPRAAPGNPYIDAGPDGRSCNRVMRMENLTLEFASLMSELGHPEIKLPKTKSFASGCKDLNMLEPETRALIGTTYRQDFIQFGYTL